MDSRIATIAILILLIAPFTLAAPLEQVSPVEGATIDPLQNGFSFRTFSKDIVKECTLYINGEPKKTMHYNDVITGRSLEFSLELPDGELNWSVTCTGADNTTLETSSRKATVKTIESPITVKSSGIFRGSMAYEFKFKNSADQQPVTVKKLAAGDFIWISLSIAPSNIKKELYVKRFAVEEGKRYLYLEDLKKKDTYKVLEGENTTVNISTSNVILKFTGVELNRATVVIYPSQSITNTAPDTTDGSDAGETDVNTTIKNDTPKETGGEIIAPPKDETNNGATPDNADNENAQENPGVFKRFISWLTGLFGA